MDVTRRRASWRSFAFAVGSPLLFAACNFGQNSVNSGNLSTSETSSTCASQQIATQFIVNWKDGHTTKEKAADKETFIRDFLKPHAGEINFAEHDHRIHLIKEPAAQLMAESVPPAVNWGQNMVQAPAVWAQGIQGQGITVAVVDSGVDITHAQLSTQVAMNSGEMGTDSSGHNKSSNGIDDDNNGYVDDVHGWDFTTNSPVISDHSGHGTHVSGIILANHNTGTIPGMAPQAKVLPLAFIDSTDSGAISDAILAIQYAASRGARVINASWGGAPCSQALRQTIATLQGLGIVFVVAAGNSGADIDTSPEYPAAFGFAGQITVGASTSLDNQAGFSNYSTNLVDFVAPGVSVTSTYPGNTTAVMSGTSMATPFVSGAVTLLLSHKPQASVAQIKQALQQGVDTGPFAVLTRGRLNVQKAIQALDALVP
jgi:subtilisin family serine protease